MFNENGVLYSHNSQEERSLLQPFEYNVQGFRDGDLVLDKKETVYCRTKNQFEKLIGIWDARGRTQGTNSNVSWRYATI
jgi:hypothetical protein